MMQPPSILGALKNWGLKKLGLNRTFDFVVTVSLARFHKAKRLKEWYYVMEMHLKFLRLP